MGNSFSFPYSNTFFFFASFSFCSLTVNTRILKVQKAERKLLTNLGVPLNQNSGAGSALSKSSDVIHTLFCGSFGKPIALSPLRQFVFPS
jgi:hypothetical protein